MNLISLTLTLIMSTMVKISRIGILEVVYKNTFMLVSHQILNLYT